MERHYDLSDDDFETRFAGLSLDPTVFTHEAHLRLAWIHIRKYGAQRAIENLTTLIQAFAIHHDDTQKYHETVTVAAVRAVYHFALQSKAVTFKDFITEYPRLKTSFKQLLDSHYSIDMFSSPQAKSAYLEPDLMPFDEI